MGVVAQSVWRSKVRDMLRTQGEEFRRQLASTAGHNPPGSLSLFLEIINLVIELELVYVATCFWTQAA